METPSHFYHIVTPERWESFQDNIYYEAESLATEGFIHASTAAQVAATMNRYYKGQPTVLLLYIDASRLTSELKYELAPSVNEYFPHIYGPLNKDAVDSVLEVEANEDGSFGFEG